MPNCLILFTTLIFLVFIKNIYADNYPSFIEGTLFIPRIDTHEQVGFYQDVSFKLKENNNWELLSFNTAKEHPLWEANIDKVELIEVETFPVQIFLKISVAFADGCGEIGQVDSRLIGEKFEFFIYEDRPDLPVASFGCATIYSVKELIIPIPVYDLVAGEYGYTVNNKHSGKFSLVQDNKLTQ